MDRNLTYERAFQFLESQTGIRTQIQLSKVILVRQALISDAKRRGIFPEDWCKKLQEKYPELTF